MSMDKRKQPQEYKDGRTKQAFADECDINKIMIRANKAGTISHLEKFEGVYADYSDFDFLEQTTKLARGAEIFAELNAELRQEFNQSPAEFFAWVNKPENVGRLREKMPPLAAPGRQNINVAPTDASANPPQEAIAQSNTNAAEPAATPPAAAEDAK